MWTCPRCGHHFYNKNQSHSCGGYTVDDFLEGKPEHSVQLFNDFLDEYRKIGPFELHPVKTRIALLTKMRFCSVNKIGAGHIAIHLVLTTPFEHTLCFYKIDNLANRFFVHHARIYDHEDFTAELKYYMALAYKTGNREHIDSKKNV
ncbi:MAG TPA: DUF5655 domain-containing protein [Mucilaginibacter sp.]|nr:DUF5655 domain-containing protein [Mucilaginibacter sp.]